MRWLSARIDEVLARYRRDEMSLAEAANQLGHCGMSSDEIWRRLSQ